MCRYSKCQFHVHPAGITFDRSIDKFFTFGKCNDLIDTGIDLLSFHSEDGSVQINILPPGQFSVKPSSYFEHTGNPSLYADGSFGGCRHTCQQFKQRRFSGTICTDHTDPFSSVHIKGNIFQCIKTLF